MNSSDHSPSCRPTKVEVPKELPKVSMVNTSLKKLKHHLTGFDVIVKERTTATAITEGSWGFEHTKACFRDEIILFVKAPKDIFNTYDQYLIDEINESQEKDTVIRKLKERIKSLSGNRNEDKVKKDIEEIETINIELDHRVSKLIAENEHLKQTYKQLYDSIKPTRIRSKEQCDALVNQVNQKSVEISYLNELLIIIRQTCPSINNSSDKLVAVTPKNKDKRVRFTEPVTSSGNTNIKTASLSNLVSNKPMLPSTRVKPSTSASGSQPSGNTKKDKIQRTPSSTQKNKVEAYPRTVKSSLKNKKCVVESKGTADVQHSKFNANSKLLCVKCNGCMLFDNHDLCVLNFINDVNARVESKSVKKNSKRKVWKPTGKNQVKFATCTLLGAALTWWNGQIRTLGPEAYAMTWEVLKRKMTDKYCPQGEIKKLEIELWNLKVKGNDVPAYTERFQELTLICTKFVANETEKVDKYLSGLPDNIYGNVKAAKPKTLDETIELANDLMDRKLLTYAERQSDNKRKADDSSRNNHGHQQQPFKRQNVARVYNMGTGERKPYGGSLPKCNKCHLHHNGPCTQRCHKCNKIGHFARDCRSTGNTNVANTQKGNGATPKGNGCFECGAPGHFKRDCPKLKNKNGGNGNAQGWVYAVGNAEKRGNAPGNPDANVVTAQISAKKEENNSKETDRGRTI
ncbi:putative reverse transcriptase domain-containing protein [Tanacetum coccineum]